MPNVHFSCGTKEECTTTMALGSRQLRGRPCTVSHFTRPRGRLVQQWPDVRNAFDGWSKAARVELANKVSRHIDSIVSRWGTRPVDNAELVARHGRACRQRAAGYHPQTFAINLGYADWQRRGCIHQDFQKIQGKSQLEAHKKNLENLQRWERKIRDFCAVWGELLVIF